MLSRDRSFFRVHSLRLLFAALVLGVLGATGPVAGLTMAATPSANASDTELHGERPAMTGTDTDTGTIQEPAEAKAEKSRWKKIWGWVLIVAY
ncbi:MAG: hypothetical protein JJE01_13440, partial [Gemmatimonadetes bacterium]|nr:hypothetical protein [Gemmatimonadota bacterium]